MVVLIAVDDILEPTRLTEVVRQQTGEEGLIRGKAGAMQNRRLGSDKGGNPPLELEMDRLRPADKADGRHSKAPFVQSTVRGLLDPRIIGQTKVVVRGQHDLLTPGDANPPPLLAIERDFILVDLLPLDLLELTREGGVKLLRIHTPSTRKAGSGVRRTFTAS